MLHFVNRSAECSCCKGDDIDDIGADINEASKPSHPDMSCKRLVLIKELRELSETKNAPVFGLNAAMMKPVVKPPKSPFEAAFGSSDCSCGALVFTER